MRAGRFKASRAQSLSTSSTKQKKKTMQFLGFLISLAAIASSGRADSSFASDLDNDMNPEYYGYGEQKYANDVPSVLPQFFEEPESGEFEKFVQEYRDDDDGVGASDQQQFDEDGEEEEEVYLVFEEHEDRQFEDEDEEGEDVSFDQEDQETIDSTSFQDKDQQDEEDTIHQFDDDSEVLDPSSSSPEFEDDLSAEFQSESANEEERIVQFQAASNSTSSTAPKRKGNPLLFFGIIAGVIILIALGSFIYHRVKVKRALASEEKNEAGASLISSTDKPLTKN